MRRRGKRLFCGIALGHYLNTGLIFCVVLAFTVGGCSSSSQSTHRSRDRKLEEFEKEFDPSQYDRQKKGRETEPIVDSKPREKAVEPVPGPAVLEKVPGFRVQIHSTNSMDDALEIKKATQVELDTLKVYMVFDAPYYKIRIGDFPTRADADRIKQQLRESGYGDAWVVPDRIMRVVSGRRSE